VKLVSVGGRHRLQYLREDDSLDHLSYSTVCPGEAMFLCGAAMEGPLGYWGNVRGPLPSSSIEPVGIG